MASDFQIFFYKFEDSLFLKLTGDFDEGSANQLIDTLTKHGARHWDIFIDTNDLETIHPFGRDVFQKNFSSIKKSLKNLIIIGVNKYKFEQDLEL